MADKYIVYNDKNVLDTWHVVLGVYATDKAATDAVGKDQTAVVTAITTDDDLEPGWLYNTNDGSVAKTLPVTDGELRKDWAQRIASAYDQVSRDVQVWWPTGYPSGSTERTRADNVVTETRNWLLAQAWCMVQICVNPSGSDTLSTLDNDAKEKLVAHLEGLAAGNIAATWYGVGIGKTDADTDATGWRTMTTWNYSDIIDTDGSPRSPDYSWNALTGVTGTLTAGFRPDAPVTLD